MDRKVNVDELVSLAISASLIQGEFLTAAVVSFVMTIGGLIEQVTGDSARKAIKSLVQITPGTATVLAGGEEKIVPIDQVAAGDTILIKPGERIAVDARIRICLRCLSATESTMRPHWRFHRSVWPWARPAPTWPWRLPISH